MNNERDESAAGPASVLRLEGPSFSPSLKVLATLAMLALAGSGWRLVAQSAWSQMDSQSQLVIGAAMLVIAATYAGILVGRTSIDGLSLRQTGLWTKEVRLAEITRVKLIFVPWMSWLIAPRLVVRTGGLSITTFHVADRQVLAACQRLAYG